MGTFYVITGMGLGWKVLEGPKNHVFLPKRKKLLSVGVKVYQRWCAMRKAKLHNQ